MKKYVVDTNVLMRDMEKLNGLNIILLSHVLREIEKHKESSDSERAYRARVASRYIDKKHETFTWDTKDYQVVFDKDIDPNYTDNKIIQACIDNGYGLITYDLLLKHKARMYGIELYEIDSLPDDTYCGYKVISMTDEELSNLYQNLDINKHNLLTNEYLIVKDVGGKEIDCLKWDGANYIGCSDKNLNTIQLGKFKALDMIQRAAIDSLFNNDVTLLRGKAGSGKSIIALNYAINQLEKGKISRIICAVNPVPVKHAQEIGFYKGDKDDKLMQSGIGNILISKFGDRSVVDAMIATGKIVLLPIVDIRGYDTQHDSLVWITEAQNLSSYLMKLILQRVGNGSKIIIDGDDKAQVDNDAFSGVNNGIRRMSRVFRGESIYGEIEFTKIYRSKIAEIADRM